MSEIDLKKLRKNIIAWDKGNGLLPAIIQCFDSNQVLMLGYMNMEALKKTFETGKVTFFSRSRNCIWVKGETSGNWLDFIRAEIDCDGDTLLIEAKPHGPTCHTGSWSCFNDQVLSKIAFLDDLENIIERRKIKKDNRSYTSKLFEGGAAKIAQKVGEEGVELALSHLQGNKKDILGEAADVIYHLMVLIQDANLKFEDVVEVLNERNRT